MGDDGKERKRNRKRWEGDEVETILKGKGHREGMEKERRHTCTHPPIPSPSPLSHCPLLPVFFLHFFPFTLSFFPSLPFLHKASISFLSFLPFFLFLASLIPFSSIFFLAPVLAPFIIYHFFFFHLPPIHHLPPFPPLPLSLFFPSSLCSCIFPAW